MSNVAHNIGRTQRAFLSLCHLGQLSCTKCEYCMKAASSGKKWKASKSWTLDLDVVNFAENWLQLVEENYLLLAREYSFFETIMGDGRMGGLNWVLRR